MSVNPRGRLGRFGKKGKYDFDEGIFVELDDRYEIIRIWQLNEEEIKHLESKETKGRGRRVYAFQQSGAVVYDAT